MDFNATDYICDTQCCHLRANVLQKTRWSSPERRVEEEACLERRMGQRMENRKTGKCRSKKVEEIKSEAYNVEVRRFNSYFNLVCRKIVPNFQFFFVYIHKNHKNTCKKCIFKMIQQINKKVNNDSASRENWGCNRYFVIRMLSR